MKAQELLDLLNSQNSYKDVYKVFLAYCIGTAIIDPETDKNLNNAISKYEEDDNILSFIDERVYNVATSIKN